jgi:hypothetical protein
MYATPLGSPFSSAALYIDGRKGVARGDFNVLGELLFNRPDFEF